MISRNELNYEHKMLKPNQVLKLIDKAAMQQRPLSLVRFGHLELAYLGRDYFPNWVRIMEQFGPYSGVTVDSHKVSQDLYRSLAAATIIGLHKEGIGAWEDKKTAKLTRRLFKRIGFKPQWVCSAYITHEIILKPRFWQILKGRKVALVGRRAEEARAIFMERGITISQTSDLEGYGEIEKVYQRLSREQNWDIALISAGIPAKVLAPYLARKTKKVVIDFGHGLDKLIEGGNYDYWQTWKKWKQKNKWEGQ